jgi:hypothetical protein
MEDMPEIEEDEVGPQPLLGEARADPSAKLARTKRVRQLTAAASSVNASSASGSRSMPINRPLGPMRSATSRA